METKLLVVITFLLFMTLAFLVVTVSSYFIMKSEELTSKQPVSAKSYRDCGTILMVFGLVVLLMSVWVGFCATNNTLNWLL